MPSLPMIRLQHHRQEHSASCLAACVVIVLAHHRVEMSEVDLRRILKTKPYSGAHPISLLQLGELGFDAWPYEGTAAELRLRIASGLPVIVFLWTGVLQHWKEQGDIDYLHSVVVAGLTNDTVLVHDPALPDGPIELPWEDFCNAWQYSRQMMAVIQPHVRLEESVQL